MADVVNLAQNVELSKFVDLLFLVFLRVNLGLVADVNILDSPQPVIDQTELERVRAKRSQRKGKTEKRGKPEWYLGHT